MEKPSEGGGTGKATAETSKLLVGSGSEEASLGNERVAHLFRAC